jgi:hypothetical protein
LSSFANSEEKEMAVFSLGQVTYRKVQDIFHVSEMRNIFLQATALPELTVAYRDTSSIRF